MARWLTLGFLFTALPVTQGAVVYTEIGQRGVVVLLGDHTIPIDFDTDGVTDLEVVFSGPGSDATAVTNASTRIVAIPAAPPDLGSTAFNYFGGESVGSILPFGSLEFFSGVGNLRSCRSIGCIGLFAGGTHFLGVEFEKDGNTHYGYVEVDIPFDTGVAAGQVVAHAYESEPDTAITAGVIPEPSPLLMFAGSALVGLARCKRGSGR